MSAMKHEELVQLLQEGKIGHLRFVMEGYGNDNPGANAHVP